MFFLLAGVMNQFYLLKYALAFVLLFVGAKMLVIDFYQVPIGFSLAVIAVLIVGSVFFSLLFPKKDDSSNAG
jgi:tellurite resistance protein TerC